MLKSMWDENIDPPLPFELQPKTGKRVAVIGSGPAGASAAFYLLVAGHDVTIFEKDPEPGGMLRYGIPQYRLPKIEVLDGEYQSITRLGGRFECGKMLGRDFTTADLKAQGYDAVIVAIGCYDTNDLGIPGEDAEGVIDDTTAARALNLAAAALGAGAPPPKPPLPPITPPSMQGRLLACWRRCMTISPIM